MPTSEEEAARAVLGEFEKLGPFPGDYLGVDREDAQIAALIAFARRAKAEALRAFADEIERAAPDFTVGHFLAAELRNRAAKLEEAP